MYTTSTTEEFLVEIAPFNRLSSNALARVSAKSQLQRYCMGQPILLRDKMPAHIAILYQGQARLLGYEPGSQLPVTLQYRRALFASHTAAVRTVWASLRHLGEQTKLTEDPS